MTEELEFYGSPGVMTGLPEAAEAMGGLPDDPAEIAPVVQGLILHAFWAEAYGVDLPPERVGELQTRSAAAMVRRILELDARPLIEPREPGLRFVGNCRHFTTLAVALLRRIGIPSRARCGFANYFEPGKWVDHWVVEYWNEERWRVLDAQVDPFQREAIGLTEDPGDLPPGWFLPAGEAWLRCQAGSEDPDQFGILDMWGTWFIEGNIARDLAALNKVEMLPWDGWGALAGGGTTSGGATYVESVATLTMSDDHQAVRRRYETDDGLRVPPRVTSFSTPAGPLEVDVPEIG
jgi:Transglutaminase-like superfamily